MEQYIPKSILVMEIKQRLHKYEKEYEKLVHYEIWITAKEIEPKIKELKNLLSFIDTLEMKEFDLEKECSKYFEDNDLCVHDDYIKFAKYFFDLGLKAQKVE